MQVEHPFALPGHYEVRLTLRNGAGQQRTLQTRVEVGHFQRLIGRDCSQPDSRAWCWQMPTRAVHEIHDIHFAESGWGLAVGDAGQLSRSEDGGLQFSSAPIEWPPELPADSILKALRLGPGGQGIALFERGGFFSASGQELTRLVLSSRDDGASWQLLGAPLADQPNQFWEHEPLLDSGALQFVQAGTTMVWDTRNAAAVPI